MTRLRSDAGHCSRTVEARKKLISQCRSAWMASAVAAAIIALPGSLVGAGQARAATTQEELVKLLKEQSAELKKLKQEVDALKKQRAVPQVAAPARSGAPHGGRTGDGFVSKSEGPDSFVGTLLDRFVERGTRPKSWRLPGTDVDLSINGFAKLDFISRLKGEFNGTLDSLPTNAIAIDSRGTAPANRFHARESRIGFVATKQTDFGLANVQIEGDFFSPFFGSQLVSNRDGFSLRHAKVEIGPLLAGQFWGTFSDPSTIAETLDFQGAPGYTFIRQAQIRYTHTFSKGVTLAFAAENPETSIVVNNNIAPIAGVNQNVTVVQTRDNNIPDFVIRGRVEDSWGHVQLGLLLRSISGENFAGGNLLPTLAIGSNPDIAPTGTGRGNGFGVAGSIHAKINLPGLGSKESARTDFIAFQFLYGSGLGRYLQDSAGASGEATINPITGRLELLTSYGGYVTFQHQWSENLRSNFTFSLAEYENPAYLNRNAYRGATYASGNLIWTVVKDFDLGAELQYGERINQSGRRGDVLHVQTSAKFSF